MAVQINDILGELGWADGFHIPVANEENKKLEGQLEQLMRKKGMCSTQTEQLNERINSLTKHMENVKAEYQQNQALITAHRSQIETEDHLYRMAKAQEDALQQGLRQMEKSLTDLRNRQNSLNDSLTIHRKKLECLKANITWDKEALLAWEEEIARGEEDTGVLNKCMLEDDGKAKEMELRRQRLCMDVEEQQHLLTSMLSDLHILELVFDRTVHSFRKLHNDRCDLVSQWEGAVRLLHKRDEEIHRFVEEINLVREHAREQMEGLREHQNFLQIQLANNRELEAEIAQSNRQSIQLRSFLAQITSVTEELRNELQTMRHTLDSTGVRLEHQRTLTAQLVEGTNNKHKRREELAEQNIGLKKRLEVVTDQSVSAADRTRQLEEMVQMEEKTVHILEKDVCKLQEMVFRAQNKLFDLKKEEQILSVSIRGCESSKALLSTHIAKLEREMLRQTEMIYNLDYEAQRIESRITHLLGERGGDEREVFEKKITELEEVLQEKTATFNLLNSQMTRLQDMMRRLTTSLALDSKEFELLKNKRQDKVLRVEGGQKQLKLSEARNQERQVEENVLRLRVAQAEEAIGREGNQVYSLERQKLSLERAMKERQLEIAAYKDYLLVKKRGLDEDKSRLVVEVQERNNKIGQLQKRYDIIVSSLGHSDDGETMSVALFKIKTTQEKYLLQQEGDELDAKIRKAEKEILAMENTLKVVNTTNYVYKKNLSLVDQDSPEFMEKEELESQYYVALDRLRYHRAQLSSVVKDVQVMEETLFELSRTEDNIRTAWKDKDQQAADLDKELREQQQKLLRADKRLKKLIRELRGRTDTKVLTIEERDMEARELQELNQSALQQLAELCARHMETGPVVTHYLSERGLTLPTGAPIKVTCRSSKEAPPSSRDSDRSQSSIQSSASPTIVTLTYGLPDEDSDSLPKVTGSATSLKKKPKK